MKKISFILVFFFVLTGCFSQSFEWAGKLGGVADAKGNSSAVDGAGNVYLTGYFNGIADMDPGANVLNLTSAGDRDIFIVKLDHDGNLVWAKQIGGIYGDIGASIAVDNLGNCFVTGQFLDTVDFNPGPGVVTLTSAGAYEGFICKFTTHGDLVWASSFGSNDYDYGTSVALDPACNVYITGIFSGTVDFDPGTGVQTLTSTGLHDAFIYKLDSSGNYLLAKQLGGTGSVYGTSVKADNAGNIYSTGYFNNQADFDPGLANYPFTSAGIYDAYISKLDPLGNFLWAAHFGSTGFDKGLSITLDPYGNVYTTGSFSNTVDFDPGTASYPIVSNGAGDCFINKLDNNGQFIWTKHLGGIDEDNGMAITVDPTGNVYTTGSFLETVDFDPGPGSCLYTFHGELDIFISKLNSQGDFVWAEHIGSDHGDAGASINVDADGNVYTFGYFSGAADFDPDSVNTFPLSTAGGNAAFILKLSQEINGIEEDFTSKEISLYPNPAQENITVETSFKSVGYRYTLYNSYGMIVKQGKLSSEHVGIQTDFLSPGVYLFSLNEGNSKGVRFIKY